MLTKSISTRYQYIYWREVRRYILWILDEKSSEAQWKCFECVYFITSPSTQDFQVFKIQDHLWLTENDRAAWFYLLKDATTVTQKYVSVSTNLMTGEKGRNSTGIFKYVLF